MRCISIKQCMGSRTQNLNLTVDNGAYCDVLVIYLQCICLSNGFFLAFSFTLACSICTDPRTELLIVVGALAPRRWCLIARCVFQVSRCLGMVLMLILRCGLLWLQSEWWGKALLVRMSRLWWTLEWCWVAITTWSSTSHKRDRCWRSR